MILADAISLVKERLKGCYGKEEINAIAILLCQHFFGIGRTAYHTSKQAALTDRHIAPFMSALDKLQNHCPVQYVLGETDFYGYTLNINKSVLIPRPETEELVNWICNNYKDNKQQIKILDIGTGSGAIAISLAKELGCASVTAIDISAAALDVAKTNASQHSAAVCFLEEDIFSPSPQILNQQFDVIVSNPPYVCESERELMSLNVLNYEPASALFVPNNNPLIYYKAIAKFALQNLSCNGSVYLEINEALGKQTETIFLAEEYQTTLRKDMNGKDRMLEATKQQNG